MEANGLCSEPIFEELLREGGRRQVVEASLFALPVVKDLNIFGDRVAGLLTRGETLVMHDVVLERALKPSIGALTLVYPRGRKAAQTGHEVDTLRELARQIAELKGTWLAGEFNARVAYPAHRYLVPDDTLTLAQARKLGVRSVCDLFGGVVPFPFAASHCVGNKLHGNRVKISG